MHNWACNYIKFKEKQKLRKEEIYMAKKKKTFPSFVNNPVDFTLVITILLLLSIGLVMVLSASSPSALAEDRK